jgi:energy-coupling factor transporter ATP-binding protein EcfA2
MKTTTPTPLPIVRLEVEQLFGKYSYTLPSEENAMMVYSPVILYGNNGTGKTTLLNILFHLLSPKLNRDHRAFLTKIPFAKFSVFFADGKQLCVSRPDGALEGTFSLQLFQGKDRIAKVKAVDQDFSGSKQQEKLDQFYQELFKVPFRVYFIRDNRTIEINSVDDDSQVPVLDVMRERGFFEDEGKLSIERVIIHKQRNANLERDQSLRKSIQSLEKWLKDQAVSAFRLGGVNVNQLYQAITQKIAQSKNGTQKERPDSPGQLIKQLEDLETRSNELSQFGLTAPLDIQKFVAVLQTQTNEDASYSITWQVLKPYIDSVSTQLEALQNTKKLLSLFINKVNQLFRDKEIQLHVQNGLTMTTSHNQQKVTLSPEMLSSGEKQLLLLFCNTLTARDEPTLFIIDEPEISLNIKWTRQLIATLLDFIEGSSVQLLLATHSIELQSPYRHQVVKLLSTNKEK